MQKYRFLIIWKYGDTGEIFEHLTLFAYEDQKTAVAHCFPNRRDKALYTFKIKPKP